MSLDYCDEFVRRLSRRSRSCRGMTLVELMVVTAIFGVVIGAIYSLMLPVQKSTFTQTRVVDMQDDLRLALDRMTLDVRHAGMLVNGDPIANLNANPPRMEFTIRLSAPQQSLGARIVELDPPVPGNFRLDPPNMLERFSNNQSVKIVDAVSRDVVFPTDPAGVVNILITDVGGNDNTNNPARFDDNTITFSNLTAAELEALESGVLYLAGRTPGAPFVNTITYIFDPNDNTMVGGARPTLRRFEDWPPDGAPIPDPLPNPLPANWLMLGGDQPIGGARKTFAPPPDGTPMFNYDPDTQQVTIDISGTTEAYDPNRPNDNLANVKPRRLQTSVALRNAIPTY